METMPTRVATAMERIREDDALRTALTQRLLHIYRDADKEAELATLATLFWTTEDEPGVPDADALERLLADDEDTGMLLVCIHLYKELPFIFREHYQRLRFAAQHDALMVMPAEQFLGAMAARAGQIVANEDEQQRQIAERAAESDLAAHKLAPLSHQIAAQQTEGQALQAWLSRNLLRVRARGTRAGHE